MAENAILGTQQWLSRT